MSGPLYIGVDLGGTTVNAGLVDASGAVLREMSVATESERAADLFRQLTTVVGELRSDPENGSSVAAVARIRRSTSTRAIRPSTSRARRCAAAPKPARFRARGSSVSARALDTR